MKRLISDRRYTKIQRNSVESNQTSGIVGLVVHCISLECWVSVALAVGGMSHYYY